MSVDLGGDTRSDKPARRIAFEDALLAFRPELREKHESVVGREIPPPQTALEQLNAADLPRLLKHHAVLDGLLRSQRTRDLETLDRAVDVLQGTIPRERSLDSPIRDLRLPLSELSGERLGQRQWDDWVRTTDDVFAFTLHERTFSACNDCLTAPKRRCTDEELVESALVVGEFTSTLKPADFRGYVNPLEWPRDSVFWEAMTPLDDERQVDDGVAHGWNRTLRETVNLFGEALTVPLAVALRTRHDGSRVWVRFNVARDQPKDDLPVNVDTGTVSAESIGGGRTLVQATKYINWTKVGANDFVSLCCDFGWVELMAQMADKSLEPHPEAREVGVMSEPDQPPPAPLEEEVKRFVDNVAAEYKGGVDQAVPELRRLLGRFIGNTWDPRWVNDLLAIAQVSLERSGNVVNHVRGLAEALQAEGQRKDGDE
jgi:hypothetical protein